MKWVTKIEIEGYRAFKNKVCLNVPYGSHTIIYGENGSGKSSIYKALHDILRFSTDGSSAKFEPNIFCEGTELGYVMVEIADKEQDSGSIPFYFTESPKDRTINNPILQSASKVSGFLDYRKILKLHALDYGSMDVPNLFEFIILNLLSGHKIPSSSTSKEVEIGPSFIGIRDSISIKNSIKVQKELQFWLKCLATTLTEITNKANEYLTKYFSCKIGLNFNIPDPENFVPNFKDMNLGAEINMRLEYANEEIVNYHDFLNEARLSAISICLYLAAIQIKNTDLSALKIVFLDDVFIGLDTNNRVPLLRILFDNFLQSSDESGPYQLFLATYDRHWFEFAKGFFESKRGKITAFELFVDTGISEGIPDEPILKAETGYLGKAKEYFRRKDYPGAVSFLRKEAESNLKRILPVSFQIGEDGERIWSLSQLLDRFQNCIEELSLPVDLDIVSDLKLFKSALLNPSAHDDLLSPVYRSEVELLFKLVEELGKFGNIRRRLALNPSQVFFIEFKAQNFYLEFSPASEAYLIQVGDSKPHTSINTKFFITFWENSGLPFSSRNAAGEFISMPDEKRKQYCNRPRSKEDIFQAIERNIGTLGDSKFEDVTRLKGGDSIAALFDQAAV